MKKKVKGLVEEFKQFIARGNILDLAVAVIIGGAFSKIVTSLVNDMVMPLITGAIGGHSLADLSWVIKQEILATDGTILSPALTVKWGAFLQNIIDFLIIAVIVFSFIKMATATKNASERLHAEAKTLIKYYSRQEKTEDTTAQNVDSSPVTNIEDAEQNAMPKDNTDKVEILLQEIRDILASKQE